jgi:PadR family transcriptional regulator, regulatory protein AphA
MRTSVLSRALLGLLAAEPMSGYGLARLFERTLARAWPARHPQIYPALAELEEHRLLRVIETGPRRRKTYAVTEDGIAEVQRWLRESAPDRTVRNESILRLFMLWLLDSPEAIAFFDDEIESHRQRLAGFEQTLADDERQRREHGTAQGGIAFCASLALEWGIRYEREYLAWATQARDRIASGAKAWDDARERRLGQREATAQPPPADRRSTS